MSDDHNDTPLVLWALALFLLLVAGSLIWSTRQLETRLLKVEAQLQTVLRK